MKKAFLKDQPTTRIMLRISVDRIATTKIRKKDKRKQDDMARFINHLPLGGDSCTTTSCTTVHEVPGTHIWTKIE
ncbi:MAG: hypothetical protein QN773_11375 [Nitrososphaeraceae archaeon]|nr:hypothetical protein [Nitrososphaeraceae archaeon]